VATPRVASTSAGLKRSPSLTVNTSFRTFEIFAIGSVKKLQSSSPPRFIGQRSVSKTISVSSVPAASISNTLTSGLAASLPATTEPELPLPQTM
jgi:hypothetical protein